MVFPTRYMYVYRLVILNRLKLLTCSLLYFGSYISSLIMKRLYQNPIVDNAINQTHLVDLIEDY